MSTFALIGAGPGRGEAHGFPADVLEPASFIAAIEAAAEVTGPAEILQYSPVPLADFTQPVVDTAAGHVRQPRRGLQQRGNPDPAQRRRG